MGQSRSISPESEPDVSDDACRQLWCAVLQLAIDDANLPRPAPFDPRAWKAIFRRQGRAHDSLRVRVKRAKARAIYRHQAAMNQWESARDWIGSRDFREVCHLAGMDPEAVEARVRRQMREAA